VAFVRTDVSKESSASIIRVTRLDELGKTLAVLATDISRMVAIGMTYLSFLSEPLALHQTIKDKGLVERMVFIKRVKINKKCVWAIISYFYIHSLC
jgi:hypothetical protein